MSVTMTQPHNLEATVCVYEHQKTGEAPSLSLQRGRKGER